MNMIITYHYSFTEPYHDQEDGDEQEPEQQNGDSEEYNETNEETTKYDQVTP